MTLLNKIAENALKLDQDKYFREFFGRKDVQDIITRLNTEEQLFKGFDSTGKDLSAIGGPYTRLTQVIKRRKGQPTNRVTLKDNGEFYDSFKVSVERDGFVIDADTIKDGQDLMVRWGRDIIGLTDENLQQLIDVYQEYFIERTNQDLFRGIS